MPGAGTRLYLGNLPPDISENDIRKRLKTFGRTAEVDIKHRKDHEGRVTATFAHLNVSINSGNIDECLQNLNSQKWNGYSAKAELAKESYLKRMEAKRANEPSYSETFNPPPRGSSGSKISKYGPQKSKVKPLPTQKKTEIPHDEASDSSDGEVFWQKKFQTKNDVTIDIEENKKQVIENGDKQKKPSRNDLLSKFESFSNVWDDPAPQPFRDSYNYDTQYAETTDNKLGKRKASEKYTNFKRSNGQETATDVTAKNEKTTNRRIDSEYSFPKNKLEKYTNKNKCVVSKAPNLQQTVNKYKSNGNVTKLDPKSKTDKKQHSEEIRLKSLKDRMNAFQQQKEVVKKALSGEPVNKKIKFDDNELEEDTSDRNGAPARLFDDESDDDTPHNDFAVRKQFEGRKGEKLLELQARYATDERFRLDKRFAESASESEGDDEKEEMDEDMQEQQKQLSILDSILGPDHVPPKVTKHQEKGMKKIVRFDPSKVEHGQRYTVSAEPAKKKKKKNEEEEDEPVTSNETPMPEVSADRFYSVSEKIKETLVPGNKFSLRSLFGQDNEEESSGEKEEESKDAEEPVQQQSKRRLVKNPLEDGEEEVELSSSQPAVVVGQSWNETFFFKLNDSRLQEGVDFFQGAKLESKEEFEKRRYELWTSVKAKLRNVARKKVTFEHKLGGKSTKLKNATGNKQQGRFPRKQFRKK